MISVCVSNGFHLVDDQIEFFVFSVKMRRDANARAGAKINYEFAPYEFFCYCSGVFVLIRRIVQISRLGPSNVIIDG